MDFSGTNPNPLEGVEGLITDTNSNPLESIPNNSQQLPSLNIAAVENLDIDGNLVIEPQDYNLINLFAAGLDQAEFEFLLDNFSNDLLGVGATRTDADAILGYLNETKDTLLDIDNNNVVESQDYNLINLSAAGLDEAEFDFLLNNFSNDLLGDGARRTDAPSIIARLEEISNLIEPEPEPELNLSDLNGSNGFVINGIDSYDFSGTARSAGDINGDGFDDILIGADDADPNGNSRAGESYIVFGSASGFSASLELSSLDGSNGFVINGIDRNDSLPGFLTN
ncbi:Flagellar hook-length control protein FliK [Crocosphaera watsonii WH 0005]|uniref:Flagellar hook-length control protein FliK n=3 Tax=Crocosphaera watsonii TaxID=263511 RepID=T2IVW0_CROWT|nr:FG-GAP repeat protein [Crocosphaera watsonii]CCQ57781.1 Flagellar hook-length control protein FliK [Crocosphaera watsonii WH 0005]